MAASPAWVKALTLFALSLSVLLILIPGREPVKMELRYALFTREMAHCGVDYFPTLYGEPYPDYTITRPLISYWFARLFPSHVLLPLVLPTAFFASLTIVCVYLIGRLQNEAWAWYGALMTLASVNFITTGRSCGEDHMVAFFTTLAFLLLRLEDKRGGHFLRNILIFSCPVAGFLFRGPIGFVIPTSVIMVYHLISSRYRRLVFTALLLGTLFFVCMGALLYLAYLDEGIKFMRRVLQSQVVGRLSLSKPFYFYWVQSFGLGAINYPLAMVAVLLYRRQIFTRLKPESDDGHFLKLLTGWALIIMIGMSLPGTKHMRYLLPSIPALGLLAAALLAGNFVLHPVKTILTGVLTQISLLMPGALLISALIWPWAFSKIFASSLAHPYAGMVIFLIIFLISRLLRISIKDAKLGQQAIISLGVLSFAFTLVFFAEPVDVVLRDSRPFVKLVEAERQAGGDLIFYRVGPDGEDLDYVYYRDELPPRMPEFIHDQDALESPVARATYLTRKKYFDSLPEELKEKFYPFAGGRLGSQTFIAFRAR